LTPKGDTIQPLAVSAVELIPHLVRGLQELKAEKDAEISTLKAHVNGLLAHVNGLLAHVTTLESRIGSL
jgi:hypothetical protein